MKILMAGMSSKKSHMRSETFPMESCWLTRASPTRAVKLVLEETDSQQLQGHDRNPDLAIAEEAKAERPRPETDEMRSVQTVSRWDTRAAIARSPRRR